MPPRRGRTANVVVVQQPRRSTGGRIRRLFRRKSKGGSRGVSMDKTADSAIRATALVSSVSRLTALPVGNTRTRLAENQPSAQVWLGLFEDMKSIPAGTFFTAQTPLIAAEGGIATRKVVKRGMSRLFGIFR